MELRVHLAAAHAHKYDSKSAVEAVKMHLMIGEKISDVSHSWFLF